MVTDWVKSKEELKLRMTDANTRDASGRKLDWVITNWANVSKPKVIRVEADNVSDHHPIIFKIKLKNPIQKYIKPTIIKSFENYDKEKLENSLKNFNLEENFNPGPHEKLEKEIKNFSKLFNDTVSTKKISPKSLPEWNEEISFYATAKKNAVRQWKELRKRKGKNFQGEEFYIATIKRVGGILRAKIKNARKIHEEKRAQLALKLSKRRTWHDLKKYLKIGKSDIPTLVYKHKIGTTDKQRLIY